MKVRRQSSLNFLKSPITILFSIAVAIGLGLLGSRGSMHVDVDQRTIYDWISIIVAVFTPLGDMYLNMLKMTVYPILIAAIISSIAGLVKSPEIGKFLSRMLIYFIIMLFIAAAMGTGAGLIGKPGEGLSEEAKATLGRSIEKSEYKIDIEISLTGEQIQQEETNFMGFFVDIIPKNVFKSLVDELALQLVIFAILFGVAIGMVKGDKSEFIITVFEGLFKAFQTIISWLMYLLPVGLIFLIAGQIASSQKFFEVLTAMIRFIVLFYIVGLIALVLNTIIIWKRSKEKLSLVFKELLDPIIIALATRSSFATLPSAMKALHQRLGFYEGTTKLYIPLGITLGRFGNIIYFALASMFVSQLYASPMTIGSILIILVGSIFAGTATAGATGLSTLALMGIVLEPLGLPIEAVLILFMTIDTIIDPVRTLLIVHTNMAVNALVANRAPRGDRRSRLRSEDEPAPRTSLIDRIQSKGEIVLAVKKQDIPLFHSMGNGNTYHGIDIDIAKRIANEFDVKLRINNKAETESDLVDMLVSDEVDFAASRLRMNVELKNQICASKPYLTLHRALLVNKSIFQGKNIKVAISSFTGKAGVCKNSNLLVAALNRFPEAVVSEYENYDELVDALISNKAKIVYGCEIDFHLKLKKMDPKTRRNFSIITFRSSEENYIIALSKKYSSSVYVFNKVIQDGTVNADIEQLIAVYGDRH